MTQSSKKFPAPQTSCRQPVGSAVAYRWRSWRIIRRKNETTDRLIDTSSAKNQRGASGRSQSRMRPTLKYNCYAKVLSDCCCCCCCEFVGLFVDCFRVTTTTTRRRYRQRISRALHHRSIRMRVASIQRHLRV